MAKKKEEEPAFEDSLRKLEQAVGKLEGGSLPLSESLVAFEEGLKASNVCRKLLDGARQRVELLVEKNGGEFALEALDLEDEEA
ncbi:MAG: exodeoxyribonuclease VII small subunit [bacterium]|nr:exodeoxyribonuclease VII small subunit [bacterium]